MKALKVYNAKAIDRFHKRKVHNTDVVEEHYLSLILAYLSLLKLAWTSLRTLFSTL